MAREYVETITRYLTSKAITHFHFEYGGKHPRVIIQYEGHSYQVVFPLTGSDWRGPANTVSTIRHVLGLFQPKTPQADRSRRPHHHQTAAHRRRHVARTSFSEPVAPQPDKFLGPLMILKARLEAANAAAAAAEAESNASAAKPIRIALRTPWLGTKTRYATV